MEEPKNENQQVFDSQNGKEMLFPKMDYNG